MARTVCKAALTREANRAKRFVAEEDKSEVLQSIEKLKGLYRKFEQVHDEYHSLLEDEEAVEDSDAYFDEVQESYTSRLQGLQDWIKSITGSDTQENTSQVSLGSMDPGNSDLLRLFNLPKVELEPFNGDPLKYHSFIAVFDESVDSVAQEDQAKLTRLLQYTTGRARDAIRSCVLVGASGYADARKILKRRFGNNHLVTERIVSSLRHGKPVKTAEELQDLADELSNCVTALTQMKALQEVNTQSCIIEIVDRLQHFIQRRWKKLAMDIKRTTNDYPTFKDFVSFIASEAEDATDPVYGDNRKSIIPSPSRPKTVSTFASGVHGDGTGTSSPFLCVLCGADHRLWYCQAFKDLRAVERLELVKKRGLCENCLLPFHSADTCRKQSVCSVPGCGMKHTKFIHVNPAGAPVPEQRWENSISNAGNTRRVVNASAHTGAQVHMPIVRVNVYGYDVCALLDTASSNSFCSRSLVDRLGIQGRTAKYQLSTLSQSGETKVTNVVNLRLFSSDGSTGLDMRNVHVVDKIPVKSHAMGDVDYVHLKDLSIVKGNQEVHLLLGQDNSEALIPLDLRRGREGEPFAVKTLFGWALNGPAKGVPCTDGDIVSSVVNAIVYDQSEVSELRESESESEQELVQLDDCSLLDSEPEGRPGSYKENSQAAVLLQCVEIPETENCCKVDNESTSDLSKYRLPSLCDRDGNDDTVMSNDRRVAKENGYYGGQVNLRKNQPAARVDRRENFVPGLSHDRIRTGANRDKYCKGYDLELHLTTLYFAGIICIFSCLFVLMWSFQSGEC